jgi:hypothetical protein
VLAYTKHGPLIETGTKERRQAHEVGCILSEMSEHSCAQLHSYRQSVILKHDLNIPGLSKTGKVNMPINKKQNESRLKIALPSVCLHLRAYISLTASECLNWSSWTGSLWRRQSQQSFNTLTRFYFLSHSLQVSAPTGHLQARYTIRYFNGVFLIQRIRCTYAIWCRDVICCTSVLRLCIPNTYYQLNVNIKIVNIKL